MRTQENHFHADTRYQETSVHDYINLYKNIVEVRNQGGLDLNVHLPYEIQYPLIYKNYQAGAGLIWVGEQLKELFQVKLVWENSPVLNYGTWDLMHGQTQWGVVPRNIDLCLDTGHLMLGSGSPEEARARIRFMLNARGQQIQHLHVHENDLKSDLHWKPNEVIDRDLLIELTQSGRSYIFEESS